MVTVVQTVTWDVMPFGAGQQFWPVASTEVTNGPVRMVMTEG